MKLCFEFTLKVDNPFRHTLSNVMVIKECGVHPVYVSKREKFVQYMEVEWKNKRAHHVEEQQPLEFKKFKSDEMETLL